MHIPIPRLPNLPRARLPRPDLHPLLPRESDAMRNQKIMIGVIVGVAIFVFLAILIFILNKYHGTIRFSRNSSSRRGTSSGRSRSYYYGSSSRYSGGSSKGSHTSAEGKHGGMPMPPPPPPPPPPV